LKVTDLTSSFEDGTVFLCLIHKHTKSFDWSTISSSTPKENVDLAIKEATTASIPDISLDYSDIKDERAIYTFICSLYKKFFPESPLLRRRKGKDEEEKKEEKEEPKEEPKEQPKEEIKEEIKLDQSVTISKPEEPVKIVEDHFNKQEDTDKLLKETEELQKKPTSREKRDRKKGKRRRRTKTRRTCCC